MVVFQNSNRIVAILAVLGCTLALANAQDVDENCDRACCFEDCCGFGSAWLPPRCVPVSGSLGWMGTYSSEYEEGCVPRDCCEETCCGDGLEYDVYLERCVPVCECCTTLDAIENDIDPDLGGIPEFQSKEQLFGFFEIAPDSDATEPTPSTSRTSPQEVAANLWADVDIVSGTECSTGCPIVVGSRMLGEKELAAIFDQARLELIQRHLQARVSSMSKLLKFIKASAGIFRLVTCCSCGVGTLALEGICLASDLWPNFNACLCDLISDNTAWKISCGACFSPVSWFVAAEKFFGC